MRRVILTVGMSLFGAIVMAEAEPSGGSGDAAMTMLEFSIGNPFSTTSFPISGI